ncbi:MAG: RNA polymerase sigma-70 factor [Bacteroidetes bacterium]|jgi:RNA polymerase sigma-70 factor (ECF subfamily)|nr:RNA polymerase sigma-70 factor [Bacteroidota bacterium]
MTDNQLKWIEGLKAGSRKDFDEIFRRYYAELVNFCMRYVVDQDMASEIVQDMFVKLWIRRDDLLVNSSLKSYLYRATQNHALNYLNQQKIQDKYKSYIGFQTLNGVESPLDKLQESDLEKEIKRAVLDLPEKRRMVFEMSRHDGLKNKQIAEKLNISVKTVENQMTKALEQLRKSLKQFLPLVLLFLLTFGRF